MARQGLDGELRLRRGQRPAERLAARPHDRLRQRPRDLVAKVRVEAQVPCKQFKGAPGVLVDLAPVLAEHQDVAQVDHGRADAPHRGRVACVENKSSNRLQCERN